MANKTQVKQYLAYWFQLGKKIIIPSRNEGIVPDKVLNTHNYSSEFEQLFESVTQYPTAQDSYLEGTQQTIAELLSSQWEISNCARCAMPVPVIESGMQPISCVCDDLNNWPNNDLPHPRSPVSSQQNLGRIRGSLLDKQKK